MKTHITVPAQQLADGSKDPNSNDETVTLSFPCEGDYGCRYWHDKCLFPADGHGHIIFYDDGLRGRSPIPIDSLGFLAAVIIRASNLSGLSISDKLISAVLSSPVAQNLPTEVTEREKKFLADPKELERLLKDFNFVGI